MEIQEILRQLEFNKERRLPRGALDAALAQREAITPHLLQFIEHAYANAEHLDEKSDETGPFMGHIYAMYLLAQFRERAAYPLILKLFSLPGDLSEDITGDVATTDLPNVLASVAGGDLRPIKELTENAKANEWVRTAGVRTFLSLVAAGEMSRDEAVAYYAELFRNKLEREYSAVWDTLVCCASDLVADELWEDIRKAYDDGVVDSFVISLEDVERDLERDKEQVLEHLREWDYGLVEDVVRDMEGWGCFREERAYPSKFNAPERPAPRATPDVGAAPVVPRREEPVAPVRVGRAPGRNDPCPCGSGRKFKHCCATKPKGES